MLVKSLDIKALILNQIDKTLDEFPVNSENTELLVFTTLFIKNIIDKLSKF